MTARSRTLIIDAQLFQSYTFHRGMGKYSLALLGELAERLSNYTHKIIVFNNISGYLSHDEMQQIMDVAKGFSFEYLNFKHLSDAVEYGAIRKHNREVIDEYIHERLPGEDIDYLILSLFQETEVSVFPTNCSRKALVIYDLIPLQLFDSYLQVESVTRNYLSRYDTLLEADHFFAISQSVATELSLHLGIPPSRITPIFGAPAERIHLEQDEIGYLKDSRIILFPSGDDVRKNNETTVKAFEAFNRMHDDDFTLVITSSFTDATVDRLKNLSDRVVFTGNVTERQLAWLYGKSELVLFLSHAEGLGLPILEAVEFSKKIVCSDIDVFKEISSKDLYFCDSYREDSIVQAMNDAIAAPQPNKSSYERILKHYNWSATADKVADVLIPPSKENRVRKQKIAVFGPSPSGFSAIGKVIQEQHYALSRVADVVYFFDNGVTEKAQNTQIRKNYLAYSADCRDPWTFNGVDRDNFDKVFYHIGNGEYHVSALIKALAYPDTVILHDTRIKGLYNVVRSQGLISEDRYLAEGSLDDSVSAKNGEFLGGLVSKQRRVIVHSKYACDAVEASIIDLGVAIPPQVSRVNLGLPEAYYVATHTPKETVYVAMAGVMTESKGIDLANAITKIKHDKYKFEVKIFGFSMLGDDVINRLSKNESIELIRSPSDTRFLYELAHSDVLLNYRYPYHGETSYSTIEGLRFGKNVIVNSTGWFTELPDRLVCKVSSEKEAIATIPKLIEDDNETNKRKRISYIHEDYSISKYVQNMMREG